MLCFGMLECVEQQRKIRRPRAIDEMPIERSTPAAIPEWAECGVRPLLVRC